MGTMVRHESRALAAMGGLIALMLTSSATADGAAAPETRPSDREGDAGGKATAAEPANVDPELVRAREYFKRGAEAVANADWAEALAAFQRSAAIRSHPVTTFNIAVCQRALGQYARARLAFQGALDAHRKPGEGKLSDALLSQAEHFVSEIDGLLVTVHANITPPGARITVDGRPLRELRTNGRAVYFAGVRPPGPGAQAPSGRFDIVVDPGARVFTVSHAGFDEVVVTRTLPPGSTDNLTLELARLPAQLLIESNRPGAVVALDTLDVGVAPVAVQRPAGGYDVVVRKPGFVTYETHVSLEPGEQANLRANLPQLEPALTDQWWFWTAAGVVVAGAAVTTYALTRPDPERPPPDGGSLGWVVDVR